MSPLLAQHHGHAPDSSDTVPLSVRDFLAGGHFSGHMRNYTMATVHPGSLSDYITNATGGAVHYTSAKYKGFSVGVAGIFTFRTLSTDLTATDPVSGKYPRWEVELYDVSRRETGKDLDRLEELWLDYERGHWHIRLGKQNIDQRPLLLQRDSRMKPFVYRGVWAERTVAPQQFISLGIIDKVSPRGYTEWYALTEAIGLSTTSHAGDSLHTDYHEATEVKSLMVLGYRNEKLKGLRLNYTYHYLHHLLYMHWLEVEGEHKGWLYGAQAVYEHAAARQADLEPGRQYMAPDEQGIVLSAKTGYHTRQTEVTVAALRSFGKGRFLWPRELGREAFFTSQPRAWLDGLGDTEAYLLKVGYTPEHGPDRGQWQLAGNLGRYRLPEADSEFNTYGKSSFYQLLLQADYRFGGKLRGIETTFMYIGRYTPTGELPPLAERFYTTNLHHFTLVTNINF